MTRVLPGTEEFDRIIARAAALRETAKSYENQANDLLDSLDLSPTDYRRYPAGRYILDVAENKKFDAATAKRNLPPEKYQEILVPTPNANRAKAALGEDYRLCQKVYDAPKRTIITVEDED